MEHCAVILLCGTREVPEETVGALSSAGMTVISVGEGDRTVPLPKNSGRGDAIRAGLRYFLQQTDCSRVVVADVSHNSADILTVAAGAGFVLGARDLGEVSALRRFANRFTGMFFRMAGVSGKDPMSGLRGFSRETAERFLDLTGHGAAFEGKMLFTAAEEGVTVKEVPVTSADSAAYPFHLIPDTVGLYWSIFLASKSLKYVFSSGVAFLIDYFLLLLLTSLLDFKGAMEIVAAPAAWVTSSLTNFFLNRNFVFRSKTPLAVALPEYYGLAAVVFLLKTYVVMELLIRVVRLPIGVAKPIAEVVFFVSNYFIQKKLIFKKKK